MTPFNTKPALLGHLSNTAVVKRYKTKQNEITSISQDLAPVLIKKRRDILNKTRTCCLNIYIKRNIYDTMASYIFFLIIIKKDQRDVAIVP